MNAETPADVPDPAPEEAVPQGRAPLVIDEPGVGVEFDLDEEDGDSRVVDLVAFQRLRAEVEQLEDELELWRHRAETAEALSEERGHRIEELRAAVADLENRVTEPEVRYTVVRVPVSRERIVSLDEQVPEDLRTPSRGGWLRRMLGS